jgi:MoxR-like ATPase
MNQWRIFQGNQSTPRSEAIVALPAPPPWRPSAANQTAKSDRLAQRGATFQARDEEIELINAALYLRRPLLITGSPGTGKSSLAYAVAHELGLGEVLYWPITTRTTLKEGLYRYDAIGRLQDSPKEGAVDLKQIGKYIQLGPLGTALLPTDRPRILLIDEIDKGDIDLPNDLLCVFEEGGFEIPELTRIQDRETNIDVQTFYTEEKADIQQSLKTEIVNGRVQCGQFPFIVLTSNGERDFPGPFLRRCVRLTMEEPQKPELVKIVKAHLQLAELSDDAEKLIDIFLEKRKTSRDRGDLATDQLLSAVYMVLQGQFGEAMSLEKLADLLMKPLSSAEDMLKRPQS